MCLRLHIMNICGYRYLYLYLLYLFPSCTYLTYLYFLTSSTSSNLPLPPLPLPQPLTQSRNIPQRLSIPSTIYLHLPYIYEYLTSNSILPRCNNTHQQVTAHAHNELRRYSWLKTFLLIL